MIKIMLRRKLGELRITQKELSAVTGIRANTINDLYHDIAERVNFEHLDNICKALDCDLSDIVDFAPNPTRTIEKCKEHGVYKQRGVNRSRTETCPGIAYMFIKNDALPKESVAAGEA